MNPIEQTRIEKAAADCGFDLSPRLTDDQLVLRSTHFPESVSVRLVSEKAFEVVASLPILLQTVNSSSLRLTGYGQLYAVLEKAAAIARTMPNRVAEKFKQATAVLPKVTEAERLVVLRIGQEMFRNALLDYWRGRCCVTGLAVPQLLRASHIKPWARCDSDEERLDVFNGLLLAPHVDALFDGGWCTVSPDGVLRFATDLPGDDISRLGLAWGLKVGGLTLHHEHYLSYHRLNVFRGCQDDRGFRLATE